MPVSIQIETVESWFKDATPLIYDHWQELGMDTDLKGDVNTDALSKLEAAGSCTVITVRDGDAIVGYLMAIHYPHLHYQSSPPVFVVDMHYVKPAYRAINGVRLFKFAENYAKKIGCIKIYLSCKVHQDHSEFFRALGYRPSDYVFIKRITPWEQQPSLPVQSAVELSVQ